MDKTSIISKIFLAFLVAALICVPVTAHEASVSGVAAEIVADSQKLIALCTEIHDQTEFIADDESLDAELCELAESIHLFSHELESVADDVLLHAQKLQTLVNADSGNSAAVGKEIDAINENSEKFIAMLETKHADIHDLVFNAPESHEEYADATHDAAHAAGDAAKHVMTQAKELQGMLASGDAPSSPSQKPGVTATDITAELAEITEQSDKLFASAESILLDTKAIVKDDSVDQDIRDLAKTIHLLSHELEDIAKTLQENSAELKRLAADPVANKNAMKGIIVAMKESSAEYSAKLGTQHENIHKLVKVAPESREDNADAVHDACHAAKKGADNLVGHLDSLDSALDAPASGNPGSSIPAPGFGVLAATCGIFGAVAYIGRKH